jgi:hypothetical protein
VIDDFTNYSFVTCTLAAFTVSHPEGCWGIIGMVIYIKSSTFLFWQLWKLGLLLRESNFVELITSLLPEVIYICDIISASHMGTRKQNYFCCNYNSLVGY